MIQNLEPEKLMNHYEERTVTDNDFVMIFKDNKIFVKNHSDTIQFPTVVEYKKLIGANGRNRDDSKHFRYLFTIGKDDYFLADMDEKELGIATEWGRFIKMFELRCMEPLKNVFAGATAYHIYQWYNQSRFCGACGAKTVHDDRERMMRCPECNNRIYPKIAPAVIVGVKNNRKLLLTKYADREYKRYALIAGFSEIGETIEETVMREVMEETGVRVKNITYYKSQPWGFDSNLLMGFFCDLDGDDNIRMDSEELSVADWVDALDIPEQHEGISLTEEMMMKFKHDILN